MRKRIPGTDRANRYNVYAYTCDTCGRDVPEAERFVFSVVRRFPPRKAHTWHYHKQCVPHPLSELLTKEGS